MEGYSTVQAGLVTSGTWLCFSGSAIFENVKKTKKTALLVKLPPPPEDILNGNHKQVRGEKGNAAHQQTTNFIYDNSSGDRVYGQTAEHSKSRSHM